MEAILISAAASLVVFVLFLLLMPQKISSDADRRKKAMLGQMSENMNSLRPEASVNLLKELPVGANSLLARIPGVRSTIDLLLKAGLWQSRNVFFLSNLLLLAVMLYLTRSWGLPGPLISLAVGYLLPRKYLKRRIAKRNEKFLNLFPDTVDMIVRSVKSGHPLNTAMRMISENMENPVREEFKQVVDEVSYGRTLPEALNRLANRIGEQDLNFFVVVLSVQQETGGSLAEVLSNLSGIIRKRRQLRLKVKALTSEGRATSYVLGSLPVLEFGALYYVTPDYIGVLFKSMAGEIMVAIAAALILMAMWIVRLMVNIDI
jgi:tight adherence protein B